ncbi:cell division protein FtsQ/DivIB [Acidihalobacter ferrooxydans]|nr:FtsQ-type POTRA domain-containing protein [Acidihalobacter ferrooxydans]
MSEHMAMKQQRARAPRKRPRGQEPQVTGTGRLRSWLTGASVLVLVIALLVGVQDVWRWLRAPTTLPIRTVSVNGELAHLTPKQVRQVVDTHLDGGFFGVNLHAIAAALDALPWVARADVRRVWPDRLVIRIKEQHPVARWNAHALLNSHGTLFRPPQYTFPQHLPNLIGPQGKEHELMSRYVAVKNLFQQIGLRVVALDENARRAFRLRLSNGIEVIIGRDWDLRRMARMVAVYRRVLASKAADIKRIDLRYPNGFAVAWKASAGQAPAAAGSH